MTMGADKTVDTSIDNLPPLWLPPVLNFLSPGEYAVVHQLTHAE